MALIAVTIPVVSGFESDMNAFYIVHPLLTLDDVCIHAVTDNGIYLTYDDTKEQ